MDKIVTVAGGRVSGVQRGGVWSFSGIPYARAPEGPLRWRPPQPPEAWDGVRVASEFGTIAPQPLGTGGITSPSDPAAADPQSEDCLTLNVWTPDVPESVTDVPLRPVMLWIHGGGFTTGSGSVFLYRGGSLCRHGDVVVVTINYRLGALGFLGHRGLEDPDGLVGNWGLHDQVAALRWVRDHIAGFGGDPSNVTIFGESAGGFSVGALLAIPAAAGLFRRAIVQSGGPYAHSIDEGERAGDRLAAALDVASCTRQNLESIPAADLVSATDVIAKRRPDAGVLPLPFLPVVDGTFLPRHPLRAVEDGSAAGIDLMIGTNRDEMTLFGLGNPALLDLDESGVNRWVSNAFPDVPTDALVASYREARTARSESVEARDTFVAVGTDGVFRWPSYQLAAAQASHEGSTYVYLFDWESPAFGGVLGSCHALELPFVFGAVGVPAVQLFSGSGPEVDELSTRMQQAWLAFARSGNPSHELLGQWPTWDATKRTTMIFGPRTGVEVAPRDEELALWEQYRPLFAVPK
jgi:para-nitrobenzyl esterase